MTRRLSVALPIAGLSTVFIALTAATGKLRALVEALPLPEPKLNGFPLLCLAVLAGGCLWRLSRIETPAHEFDELAPRRQKLEKWPVAAEPLAGAPWPLADPGSPWFGTAPFTEAPPVRRLHPVIPAEDLDPDPEQVARTLLPVRPEGVRR